MYMSNKSVTTKILHEVAFYLRKQVNNELQNIAVINSFYKQNVCGEILNFNLNLLEAYSLPNIRMHSIPWKS